MKILHLITRLILGGAQENTVLSCAGQVAAGHEVTLAYGPIYGPEGSLDQNAREAGCELVQIDTMTREVRPLTDYRCYRACRKLIRELKPDVVHTHSSKAGIVGRAAAWAEGVPAVVHTIHGLAFHPYQSRVKNAIYIAAERWAAERCHAIATVADAMATQALAAGIGRSEQYTTVYSGMETATFLNHEDDRAATRAEFGLADDELVIGTVARLAELKGHDDLIDALAADLPDRPNTRLMWVGDGWWRQRLEQKLADRGLKDRVVVTGMVPPEQVPRMIRAMDILVHPSYREGLARALPQALLSSVPVISYDCDGAGEVCIDGETGRLVKTGDTDALREAVWWMADHPGRRAEMGAAGRELCRQRFDTAAMVDALDKLYQKVLEQYA
ncbi:MAG: glycosyltransferase family 4 protein [Planctomycetota bacterium]|jgi:glycosyltransferase involved in cell wall biosynthesis